MNMELPIVEDLETDIGAETGSGEYDGLGNFSLLRCGGRYGAMKLHVALGKQ